MTRRDQLAALVRPIASRMSHAHCWIRTADGPRRIAKRFDETCLSEHVTGAQVYGLCPIAPGESVTRVACLDFDSHRGETPWSVMLETARRVSVAASVGYGLEAVPYRSSGGSGVHLYFAWGAPQDAYTVRETLREVLAECGLRDGTGGVARGEVEVYPKQDGVPVGGFGSMFVLPLGGGTRSERLEL